MTNPHPLAALIAGVKVKDFEVEIVRGNVGGNLALYFNDYRVAGSKPWGGGTTIHKFRVQGDDVKSSGILATIRDFQNVPVVKECLTTDAALEAAPVPDLGEAGKRHADKERNLLLNTALSDLDSIINGHDPEVDTSLNNLVWDRLDKLAVAIEEKSTAALIALATAQAAQIAGLEVYQKIAAEAERVAAYEKGRAEAAEAAAATLRAENERLRGASKALCDAVKADDGSNHHHFTISGLAKALLAALEAAP